MVNCHLWLTVFKDNEYCLLFSKNSARMGFLELGFNVKPILGQGKEKIGPHTHKEKCSCEDKFHIGRRMQTAIIIWQVPTWISKSCHTACKMRKQLMEQAEPHFLEYSSPSLRSRLFITPEFQRHSEKRCAFICTLVMLIQRLVGVL
jgi:hypothetical protein